MMILLHTYDIMSTRFWRAIPGTVPAKDREVAEKKERVLDSLGFFLRFQARRGAHPNLSAFLNAAYAGRARMSSISYGRRISRPQTMAEKTMSVETKLALL